MEVYQMKKVLVAFMVICSGVVYSQEAGTTFWLKCTDGKTPWVKKIGTFQKPNPEVHELLTQLFEGQNQDYASGIINGKMYMMQDHSGNLFDLIVTQKNIQDDFDNNVWLIIKKPLDMQISYLCTTGGGIRVFGWLKWR
jgi:hypothetical protein